MQTDFLEKVARAIENADLREVEGVLFYFGDLDWPHTIFTIGNGGSASLASHFINDLHKFTNLRGVCLADNIPTITAIANDINYNQIFSSQLERQGRSGDVLLAISSSGNSPNIINAVEHALRYGIKPVALTGFDGGLLKQKAIATIHIPTEKGEYELVESVHGAVLHYLIQCLKK